jgi:hypothetical protein
MKFKFRNIKYDLIASEYYEDKSKALLLERDNKHEFDITKNIIEAIHTSENHIYIKDYSRNSGMVIAMKEAGLIEYDITNQFYAQFVTINEYKLTHKGIALWKKDKN